MVALDLTLVDSSVVTLVDRLPLAVFNDDILAVVSVVVVEKLALTDVNEPLIPAAVNEAPPPSASSTVILAASEDDNDVNEPLIVALDLPVVVSSVVTRLEKLPLSVFSADILEVVSVVVVEKLALTDVNEPLIFCDSWAEPLTTLLSLNICDDPLTIPSPVVLRNLASKLALFPALSITHRFPL
tara:strand:- start:171 stop:725 length:555 start_codon:yes stop_codon:yes gene_type:complete